MTESRATDVAGWGWPLSARRPTTSIMTGSVFAGGGCTPDRERLRMARRPQMTAYRASQARKAENPIDRTGALIMGRISAHQFSEGGGMVTGTRNVDLARDWMRKEIEGDSCCDLGCQCRWCTFYDRKPTVEAGRIIPVPASREDGPGWYWQPVHESKIGTRGVTHAVVWY